MTDNWGHYFCDMGGQTASIVFDDGISSEINALHHSSSLKLKINLRETMDNGLPTTVEGDRLATLDEKIEKSITEAGGVYLGRVTNKGARWVMALIGDGFEDIEERLQQLAVNAGYTIDLIIKQDPQKLIYWEDLYPTDEDRCVMNDVSLLHSLQQKGDIASAERSVEHWTYFNNQYEAKKFEGWLRGNGYAGTHIEKVKEGFLSAPKWLVRSRHNGTMLLNDITRHTLAHLRQAKRLGGDYDGWETQVIKDEQQR